MSSRERVTFHQFCFLLNTSEPYQSYVYTFLFPVHIVYLFIWGFTPLSTHCTGHITTGSWKGRENQYIQFVRVLYCKLPTNGKQLQAFYLRPCREPNPGLRGGRREFYHSATVAPCSHSIIIQNLCLLAIHVWSDLFNHIYFQNVSDV